MSKKIAVALLVISLAVGCKKEAKKTTIPPTNQSTEEEKIIKKAYQFFSNTKELELLYTSDAWRMVLKDAQKIGLHQTQIAKLDSSFFIHYSLRGTKATIFDQKMKALPAFKNFREMSQHLTGIPLDYDKELTPIYRMHQDVLSTNTTYTIILHRTAYDTKKTDYPFTLFQKSIAKDFENKDFENRLKRIGILDFEMYQNQNAAFAIITSADQSILEQLYNNLKWTSIFDKTALLSLEESHPEFKAGDKIFKNWQKMRLLGS